MANKQRKNATPTNNSAPTTTQKPPESSLSLWILLIVPVGLSLLFYLLLSTNQQQLIRGVNQFFERFSGGRSSEDVHSSVSWDRYANDMIKAHQKAAESIKPAQATLFQLNEEDQKFLQGFEGVILPWSEWTHRSHLRVCWIYNKQYARKEAFDKMK